MRISNVAGILIVALSAALAGCATSRSELKIASPAASPAATPVTKERAVLIRSIVDERRFEEAPNEPNIPSLGFEGAAQATAEVKARAIGRKRNSFGKALGDILLEDGQTVIGIVRENLTAGLRKAGYRVAGDAAEAGKSPLVMDVRIKQFWSWFQPGFWAITLNADITTNLEISGLAAPLVVNVHAQDSRMAAGESAWTEIVNKAVQAYQTEVAAKAAGLP
ncbi:MAG: flagellar biosynthesis protein [Betaproteobacteria bacterium]|nr:flagellar biosynthesis protein [Betaproteobacteria bacterium]